ncbi:hypothetical protein F6B50_23975 [Salmonella enterica]|nr:hypothetical protein [Salmonella enterica]
MTIVLPGKSIAAAGSYMITNNGSTATLTLPLKAVIADDLINREEITILPLSSLYEHVSWDTDQNKFKKHHFLLRVSRAEPTPLYFEIINDQYTCSYNNPDWMNKHPDDIVGVNQDYSYTVSWPGSQKEMNNNRGTEINANDDWLTSGPGSDKFIDLSLNITFPDVYNIGLMKQRGGMCRGSVTMLISRKL